jgi:N-carbamoylputrescine amidase
MRIGFVEWPEGLSPSGEQWEALRRQVEKAKPDMLVTNELPFGPWIAGTDRFDRETASRSVALHETGIVALRQLEVATVLSSRPVWSGKLLANEAYVIEDGSLRPLHRKHFFPAEPGWFETTWYEAGRDGFAAHEVAGLLLGTLLCTELMFNEYARNYGKAGSTMIAVPRATGPSQDKWLTAGAMAAIVSGAYVISSNRVGPSLQGPTFGGRGFAFGPDGTLLAKTSPDQPVAVIEVDADAALRQKAAYPCYVAGPEQTLAGRHGRGNRHHPSTPSPRLRGEGLAGHPRHRP